MKITKVLQDAIQAARDVRNLNWNSEVSSYADHMNAKATNP
jgi:hypothetical protein